MKNLLILATLATALVLSPGHSAARPGTTGEIAAPSVALNDAPLNRLAFGYQRDWVTMKAMPELGNSPSSRRQNHWLASGQVEELMPVSPDEQAELYASRTAMVSNHRIREVKKERNTEATVVVKAKAWYETMRMDAPIEIYVSGGGFRGGVDPVVHDQIMISNSGLLQRLYETEQSGRTETKKVIDREELFALVQWIAQSGFFEFERNYDCPDDDRYCRQRLEARPEPIPLKVVVAVGPYRNVVSVPIFSPGGRQDYIAYPAELRKIVQAIYEFASL